jgi:hypothetical protein
MSLKQKEINDLFWKQHDESLVVDPPKQYYRFKCGVFIKATNFEEAKLSFMDQVMMENQDRSRWHECSCVGHGHRFNCPEAKHNKGIVAF